MCVNMSATSFGFTWLLLQNLMGELAERRFDFPKEEGGKMEQKDLHSLKLNQVAYINGKITHNSFSKLFFSSFFFARIKIM